jgi:uncharacterized protein YjbI with pentapeptide repeats
MANPEHVKILKRGVDAWKKWRNENPKMTPNLVGADLRGADLIGANLREAQLRRAQLQGAYLRGADLAGANLREAQLRRAQLHGRVATVSVFLTVGVSQARYTNGNRTSSIWMGHAANVGLSKAKLL